ncbi:MAG: tetratricopeptide repeat protein [Polyangiaceae bacterium]|nr:tetratricopeptide repeat protein [Polyangiaceae bacterium]
MELDILRAELERLFGLDELTATTRDLLGFDPERIGGTSAKGSFVRALVDHCLEADSIEALCDVVLALHPTANPKITQLRVNGVTLDEELAAGTSFGEYVVTRKLGEGRLGAVYVARHGGADHRLKVLRREATRDRRGLQRFMTVSRLVGGIDHAGLPRGVVAGETAGRWFVAHELFDGQPLAARIARTGPMHLNEAKPLLKALLEPLARIHERRLSHGDLRLDNVLVFRRADGSQQVVLLDAGSDRLRARARVGQVELFSTVGSPRTVAPEMIRGLASEPRSDVYSFGAVLYEVLTGKPLFGDVSTASEIGAAHLNRVPPPPSTLAPRGWIAKEVDDFVLGLLEKDPEKRPRSADTVLEALEGLGRTAQAAAGKKIDDAELESRIDALVADAESDEAGVALEAAVEEGGDPAKVAEAFTMAAEGLEAGDDPKKREAKKSLWFRAARIWEHQAKDMARAEQTYQWIVELDPSDDIATTALEDARRALGKYEELVEMLLAKSENASTRTERARALAEIGRLYATELDDRDQAIVAFVQAFCEDSHQASHADEVERLAGDRPEAWAEALQNCAQVLAADELPPESKNLILVRVGRWYDSKVQRPDLALPCFQAILTSDPANDAALEGMAAIYRRAQQWPELGMVLTRRADAAATPARARDYRTEAAEILEVQLNDVGGARKLYEDVLGDDAGHPKASEALARIYERQQDWAGIVKLLERRAESQRGEERLATVVKIGELHEVRLGNDAEAIHRYGAVLGEDQRNLDALRGLDRLYSKAGRFQDLLANLEQQIAVAATPRQKIALWERVAGIHDEEFLDHGKAASSWESVLTIDPAHEGALMALTRHYRALDRWEDVVGLYDRHLKLVTEGARRVELLLAKARVLVEQVGSPERALGVYEQVLEVDPAHPGALEALARLRESSGDADAALTAIEALAAKAATPEAKAEQLLRAAKLLEQRGDRDGAIERLKRALEANPTDTSIATSLRAAYVARGDINAAIQLLERELERAESDVAKGRLAGEIATLARDRLKDDRRAEDAAKRAIGFDPTNADALSLLGDVAFEAKRFLEASRHYEVLADTAGSLDKARATRLLIRYVDALAATGSTEKALTAMDTLLRVAPDDAAALLRVAQVTFEHGAPKRAVELFRDLFDRFGESMKGSERATSLYRMGEALRRAGELDAAIPPLEDSIEQDPGATDPLVSLAAVFEAKEDWERTIKTKTLHLDLAGPDQRLQLLIEIGDIASAKLGDRTRAAKSYVAALEDRPDDRRLLTKLMQLYSEEKDWGKLIDVVVKLAGFVEDKKQKAKYLHTAAGLAAKQLEDVDRALEFYGQVLELDPTMDRALDEAIALVAGAGRRVDQQRLLEKRLELASSANDKPRMLQTFTELGELFEKHLGLVDRAVDAYEAAQTFDPENRQRAEHLAGLYASDPHKYLDKAVSAQAVLLRQNPHRAEVYKLLRKLFTEVKQADPAWCVCQALYVLNLAEPDEERFFRRMRAETAAPAQAALNDEDWVTLLLHPDADPLLTGIFALIEPAVILARGQSFEQLGYDSRYQIDLAQHPYPISQTLHYAAGVLGMTPPPTFQNTNDPGGLSFLHAHSPSIVLGMAAFSTDVPSQAAAFIAARHLTYFRPGMYVRHLVPTGTGLKAWLFAAIKLIVPQFPVAAEMEGPVGEATRALEAHLSGQGRDQLARIVPKLLQSGGSLDLKRWVAGVDLTADRAGFVIAHDLETAVEIIRASAEDSSAVPNQERLKELVLYAVSRPYFDFRRLVSVTIDV